MIILVSTIILLLPLDRFVDFTLPLIAWMSLKEIFEPILQILAIVKNFISQQLTKKIIFSQDIVNFEYICYTWT